MWATEPRRLWDIVRGLSARGSTKDGSRPMRMYMSIWQLSVAAAVLKKCT